MPPGNEPPSPPERRALRRYGPIAAVLVVIAAVVGVSTLRDGGGDDGETTESDADAAPAGELPEGVVTWSMAQEQGLDVEFPDTCDTETGMVAIPFFFRAECVADNDEAGGATSPGVTSDTITVVVWLPNDNDPIFGIVRQALGIDDSVDEVEQTQRGLAEIFQTYYQTYGRTVDLKFLRSSGTVLDPVAARADAVKAAEYEPFAVLGGPLLASTWTEELHARGIVCVFCPGIPEPEPTAFGILPGQSQIRQHVVAYVSQKLAGGTADFAGEGVKGKERVFGLLSLVQSDSDERRVEEFEEAFADEGIEVVETGTFPLDPGRAQELSTSVVAKMKDAGVTTVVVRADPITLPAFTREATKQGWFPEWVIAGYQFTDTTTFARSFDQQQWSHAFGLSFLPPNAPREITPPYKLYEWYHGAPPPADDSLILTYPQVGLLFTGIHLAGPNLTPETFRDALFAFPPTPRAVTQPSLDYGEGIWDEKGGDYEGIDDMVELWWDPEAEGPDENGRQGTGMYRYVDGGKRYLPDDYTDEVKVFDPGAAITVLTEPPPEEVPPDYPSPAGS
jgi:methylmalonyl-CoA mutase cobalamin-binding subunit